VVPHRDRANTAAFLEEVISYVLGLKKRLAEVEGVSEADLQVPLVDVQNALDGGELPEGTAQGTVIGNPALGLSNGSHASGSDDRNAIAPAAAPVLAGTGGMPPMMLPHGFRDGGMGAAADDGMGKAHSGMLPAARGMPAHSMNGLSSNQVGTLCLALFWLACHC
jgi:hypothetical protein